MEDLGFLEWRICVAYVEDWILEFVEDFCGYVEDFVGNRKVFFAFKGVYLNQKRFFILLHSEIYHNMFHRLCE